MPRRKTPARPNTIAAGDTGGAGLTSLPADGRYVGTVRVGNTDPLAPPARPRWEYRTVYSDDGLSWKHASDEIDFNDLGTQGWELVTIYPVGDAMHAPVYYAVFKREVRHG